MGAYQVVGTTLRAAKEGLGLRGDEVMTPELQDAIGAWILQNQGTGAWEGYQGPGDPASIKPVEMAEGNALRGPDFNPNSALQVAQLNALREPPPPPPAQNGVLDVAGAYQRGQMMRDQFTRRA
jgi:hypothetical protein